MSDEEFRDAAQGRRVSSGNRTLMPLQQQARGKLDAGARFRAKLAQVDVATHDLVEA